MIDITSELKDLSISFEKISEIKQGENSATFLITSRKRKLVAKKFKNINFKQITNAFLNKEIIDQLVTKKLFPNVIYFSEEKDFLVYEYFESAKNNKDKFFLKNLGKKIREIHNIKPCKNILTYKQQLYFYKQLLKRIKEDQLVTKIESLFDDVNIQSSELVFSHNDLNINNIIFNKDICMIDYEYSSLNSKFSDIAKVIYEFKLNKLETEYFLDGYRITLDKQTEKQIILWQRFNLYIDYIWTLLIKSNKELPVKENLKDFYLKRFIDFDTKLSN